MNKDKILKEIRVDKLNEIVCFVKDSLEHFEMLNARKEYIRILMPDSIRFILLNYKRPTYFQTVEEQYYFTNLFNIEVYSHYKNEIVVYCTKFDLYKELDQPKIFWL